MFTAVIGAWVSSCVVPSDFGIRRRLDSLNESELTPSS